MKKNPVKIAYDVENQKFTFEGDGSIIGPSQSSKFYSFSVFGPSTTTNSLGLNPLQMLQLFSRWWWKT